MNCCHFTGNIVSTELKGKSMNVLTFRLAVNGRQYNSESGQWEDTADFLDCVMYGKRAKAIGGWLEKGAPVVVEAHARQNTWKDADGANRSKIEFVCDDLTSYKRAASGAAHAKA